ASPTDSRGRDSPRPGNRSALWDARCRAAAATPSQNPRLAVHQKRTWPPSRQGAGFRIRPLEDTSSPALPDRALDAGPELDLRLKDRDVHSGETAEHLLAYLRVGGFQDQRQRRIRRVRI